MKKKYQHRCRYCGHTTTIGYICSYCYERRKLIRKLLRTARSIKYGKEVSEDG